MNKVRAWMMMLTAWGYTWLGISLLCLLPSWDAGAQFAAEGAFVAFAIAIASGVVAVVAALARGLVNRRIARAEAAALQGHNL